MLCTQYLEEADELADGIAVIDSGKVIAEGTPWQLKASFGGAGCTSACSVPSIGARPSKTSPPARARAPPARPGESVVRCKDADAGAEAVAELSARGSSSGRLLGRPPAGTRFHLDRRPAEKTRPTRPKPRRRPHERRDPAHRAEELRKALGLDRGPVEAEPASAALTFGWRGMLKVEHVAEQLLDVTITPVMFL